MMIAELENEGNLSPIKLAACLESYVQEAARQATSQHEAERNILDGVLKIGFELMEQFLQLQGDGDLGETVTTPDGETLQRSEEPADRSLRTVFGLHTIQAYVYSPGPHKKITLRPIDARLELPAGRASYLLEEFSQYFCVEQAFRPSSKGLETVLRHKLSVDTLERINQRMGAQAEAFFDNLPVPDPKEEGELLVFTGDGKGVPLVKKDAERATAMENPERPGNRKMATLAGVYSVDRHVRLPEEIVAALFRDGERREGNRSRPQPKFKHIRGCFPKAYEDGDETTVISGPIEAFSWAEHQVAARLQSDQPLIRLMDGQTSLWDAADVCLESAPEERTIDILDILHVSQYVWRAAKVLHKTVEHREAFARERLLRILRGGVRGVIRGFRQMAGKRRLSAADRREIDVVCGYLEGNVMRMRYDEYLREGYPIATGVIEGACRHFVKDRMERSGMRWRLDPAQSMLSVRAAFLSSYWDDFHPQRIEREQQHLHPHRSMLEAYTPHVVAI